MQTRLFATAALLSTIALSALWQPIAAARGFGTVPDRRADLVAKALGIKLSAGGFSKPYGEALAAFVADRSDLRLKADQFLAAVEHGASPAAVYRLAVASSNVAAERTIVRKSKAWPYGSPADEIQFADWLLAKARLEAHAGHRAKAASWAKAALFASLAAAFPSGNLSLIEIIVSHGKELRGLLRLGVRQDAALSGTVFRNRPSSAEKALMTMNVLHDGFLRAKRVDDPGLQRLLKLSGVIDRNGRPCGVLNELTVISVDWQVLNMARAWHNRKATAALDAYFKHLSQSPRPEVALWARQALREIGPVPLPNMVRVQAAKPGG